MAEASDGTEGVSGNVSNQLATLVPTFDPSKDDLNVYQQKVALILEAWPPGKYTELATRLILNCTGSAFKKLQLHQSELVVNDRKSIQRIVELLGGHWGQIDLEKGTSLPNVPFTSVCRRETKVQIPILLVLT